MSVITTYYAVIERKTGMWLTKRCLQNRIQLFVRKGDAIKAKREVMPGPDDDGVDPREFVLHRADIPWPQPESWEDYIDRTGVKDPQLEVIEVVFQEGTVVG
jgi:hypothetical protein